MRTRIWYAAGLAVALTAALGACTGDDLPDEPDGGPPASPSVTSSRPQVGTWTGPAPLPEDRHHAPMAHDGKVHVRFGPGHPWVLDR